MTVHPTFDALSAFADAPSDDVSQARVRRHVRECDVCRATVAEIRAMGAAARAMPLPAAPSDLWARVAARRMEEVGVATRTSSDESRGPSIPADVPSPDDRPAPAADGSRGLATKRGKSIVLGATLVVLALATAMMLPSRTPLEATGLSRLTVSPARPTAGGTLVVRYTPAPYFRQESRLVLIGRVARGGERQPVIRYIGTFDADSLATLLPQRDGSFIARLTLPANFRAAQLAVVDSTGDRMDRDGSALWTIVGGNADHSPSLEALMAAEENRMPWVGHFDNHLVAGPQWSIADTIQHYFPAHPAGWAYYTRYGTRRGVFDFLRFFETAERKYASFDDALWPERPLDANREHAMVVFALRIEEPLEAAKWATRLAREHPDDRRAFDDLYSAIHQMQINSTVGLADSLHAWLPLLIDFSRRDTSPSVMAGSIAGYAAGIPRPEVIASLAQEFGDSAMKAAWPSTRPTNDFVVPGAAPRSMSLAEERQARAQLAEPCGRPAGKFSLTSGTAWAVQFCELVRSNLLASLSHLEAERGHASLAMALADSALRTRRPLWACGVAAGHRERAHALIMLGDPTRATQELAVAAGQSLTAAREADSLLAALGTPADRARFTTVADSARQVVQRCAQERRQRDTAHADSARFGVR
jgi:hypothetical protein